MENSKKIEKIIIWTVILMLAIAYGFLHNQKEAPVQEIIEQIQEQQVGQPTQLPAEPLVVYDGEEGRTAMDLLKANYRVETQSFGDLGEFVQSINDVEPDSSHFWAFYVNGTISPVGAGVYVTKPSDQIEWKLEKIQ